MTLSTLAGSDADQSAHPSVLHIKCDSQCSVQQLEVCNVTDNYRADHARIIAGLKWYVRDRLLRQLNTITSGRASRHQGKP